jgi:tRNA(Ile)-lysidine synthase
MTRSQKPGHGPPRIPGWMPDSSIHVILAPLANARALLLAVSGGPDSTALLLMAAHWARLRGGPRLEAATVDHGLRPEGAAEAAEVAKLCESLGVPHHTLVWSGVKPKTRLQERARDARYALLTSCAKEIGADFVVTAHHLDDQAETVLFRLLRGSGIAGLAGMAARTKRDGVTLARPLLGLSKAELIDYCEAEEVEYLRDASNEDPRFARTRMRALLKALAAEGLDAPALARLARRAASIEEALERQTLAAESHRHLIENRACDAAKLFAEPIEIVQRLLTLAIARVGKRDMSRIGLEKIETLTAELHETWLARERFSANVAGAHVICDAKGVLRVEKEPARGKSAAPPMRA